MPNNLQSLENTIENQKQIKSSNVGQDHSKGGNLLGLQDAEFQAYNQALEAKSDYRQKTEEEYHRFTEDQLISEAQRLAGCEEELKQLEEQKAKLIVPATIYIKNSVPGMICMTSSYDTCWDSDQERQKRLQKLEEKRLELAIEEANKKVAEYVFLNKVADIRFIEQLEEIAEERNEQYVEEVFITPSSGEEPALLMDRTYVIRDDHCPFKGGYCQQVGL